MLFPVFAVPPPRCTPVVAPVLRPQHHPSGQPRGKPSPAVTRPCASCLVKLEPLFRCILRMRVPFIPPGRGELPARLPPWRPLRPCGCDPGLSAVGSPRAPPGAAPHCAEPAGRRSPAAGWCARPCRPWRRLRRGGRGPRERSAIWSLHVYIKDGTSDMAHRRRGKQLTFVHFVEIGPMCAAGKHAVCGGQRDHEAKGH